MEKRHRVLIAEDQALLRGGLSAMVSSLSDYEVVGEACDGVQACRLATALSPDLVLMDLSMPEMNGIDAMSAIKRERPATRIVALTIHHSEIHIRQAYAAGADAYVIKDAPFEELVAEMRCVMLYERPASFDRCRLRIVPFDVADALAGNDVTGNDVWQSLTDREREVLRLVAQGHTNREVGQMLNLSPKTIEKHRSSLMQKLGATHATGLVRAALEMGVMALPEAPGSLDTFL